MCGLKIGPWLKRYVCCNSSAECQRAGTLIERGACGVAPDWRGRTERWASASTRPRGKNGRKKGGHANTGGIVEDSFTPRPPASVGLGYQTGRGGGTSQRCDPARARLAVVVVVQLQTGEELRYF